MFFSHAKSAQPPASQPAIQQYFSLTPNQPSYQPPASRTRPKSPTENHPTSQGVSYQTCNACSSSHREQPDGACACVTTSPRNLPLPCPVIVRAQVSFCENTATPCRSGSYGLLVHRRGCPEQLGLFVLLLLVLFLCASTHLGPLQPPRASLLLPSDQSEASPPRQCSSPPDWLHESKLQSIVRHCTAIALLRLVVRFQKEANF